MTRESLKGPGISMGNSFSSKMMIFTFIDYIGITKPNFIRKICTSQIADISTGISISGLALKGHLLYRSTTNVMILSDLLR